MPQFQISRKVVLVVFAAGLLGVAGCSNQPTQQGANKAPAAKKPNAAAKPAAAPSAANQNQSKKSAPKTNVATKSASGKQVNASAKVAPGTHLVTVPKGTSLSASIGEALASNKNHRGDSFTATLATSVKVNGKTVIPKGAKLTGQVVAVKKKSPAELTLALASVQVHGKSYILETNSVGPSNTAKADESDAAKAKKDVTVAAATRMRFRLVKSVKIAVKG